MSFVALSGVGVLLRKWTTITKAAAGPRDLVTAATWAELSGSASSGSPSVGDRPLGSQWGAPRTSAGAEYDGVPRAACRCDVQLGSCLNLKGCSLALVFCRWQPQAASEPDSEWAQVSQASATCTCHWHGRPGSWMAVLLVVVLTYSSSPFNLPA